MEWETKLRWCIICDCTWHGSSPKDTKLECPSCHSLSGETPIEIWKKVQLIQENKLDLFTREDMLKFAKYVKDYYWQHNDVSSTILLNQFIETKNI